MKHNEDREFDLVFDCCLHNWILSSYKIPIECEQDDGDDDDNSD